MSLPIFPDQVQTDPVAAPKPRRNRTSAKKAGSSFERAQADWLAARLGDDRIDRRVKAGAKDRGDIAGVRTIRGGRVVIECKDTATLALPAWLREAEVERGNDDALIGVVMHKKRGTTDPAEQYVTMTAETFAILLEGGVDLRSSPTTPPVHAAPTRPHRTSPRTSPPAPAARSTKPSCSSSPSTDR